MATVQLMKAAARKLRIAAGPATSMAAPEPRRRPVPMEPPTATMAICPAVSWWRRPSSWIAGDKGSEGMEHDIKKAMDRPNGESGGSAGESGKNFIEIGETPRLRGI